MEILTCAVVLIFLISLVVLSFLGFNLLSGKLETIHAVSASAESKTEGFFVSKSGILRLSSDLVILGGIALLAYLFENHPLYDHGIKDYDRDYFWFIVIIFFGVGLMSIKKSTDTSVLGRDQTEEWKGWMQFMFLLYHYFHAEEVYNCVRVMIECYGWMTGFGNFSFFYMKGDFSLVRVLQMLWRLNFTVLILCLTMNNSYILYYICPLHTTFFIIVYLTTAIGKSRWNYGKWAIRHKIFIAAIIVFLIWDNPMKPLFGYVFGWLSNDKVIGAGNGVKWEWYFRSTLDHWASVLGMVFALNFPFTLRYFSWVSTSMGWTVSTTKPSKRQESNGESGDIENEKEEKKEPKVSRLPAILSIVFVGTILFALFSWWCSEFLTMDKYLYNETNAFFSIIPLLTYIFFRNIYAPSRGWYIGAFHDIGKTTLETYLLQHHLWLTSNAKTLLVLLPGYPRVNFLLVSAMFLLLAKELYKVTMTLRSIVLPSSLGPSTQGIGDGEISSSGGDSLMACLKNSAVSVVVFLAACGLAALSSLLLGKESDSRTFFALLVMALVIGSMISLFLAGKWRREGIQERVINAEERETLLSSGDVSPKLSDDPQVLKKFCAVSNALNRPIVIVLLLAIFGAIKLAHPRQPAEENKGSPKLMVSQETGLYYGRRLFCHDDAIDGCWTGVDCNSNKMIWEFESSSDGCGAHLMARKELASKFSGKHILFMGDSQTRNIQHGFRRMIGDDSISSHNSSIPKHVDLHYVSPDNITVTFLWRPYITDIIGSVHVDDELNLKVGQTATEKYVIPDVVVISSGLWDCLTIQSLPNYSNKVQQLSNELKKLPANRKTIVLWANPTAIVDELLPGPRSITDLDKRVFIAESIVSQYRLASIQSLSNAVDVILDGNKLTVLSLEYEESRRLKCNIDLSSSNSICIDGVHYIDDIYDVYAQLVSNAAVQSSFHPPAKPAKLETRVVDDESEIHFKRALAASTDSGHVIGSLKKPWHGFAMLVIIAVMLYGMDGFFGLCRVSVWLVSKFHPEMSTSFLSWSSCFEPLHMKILPGLQFPVKTNSQEVEMVHK